MADDDITLDGKPLQSLRVADLKAALEQRNLPKTGQKNTLIKRLKGALMLENLQKSSSSHGGLQPNSQMGEEMSQNSFIKQYLAKQQELLRQRLEREAQQEEEEEADESSAVEERDHMDDNDDSAYVSEKHRLMASQPPLSRTEERQVGEQFPHGIMAFGSGMGSGATLHGAESREPPGAMLQRASFYQGHQEPPTPSPPRAVASLSVRVLGQPECQGLPPTVPRMQEKASTASSQSAHPVLHLSRSAGAVPAAAAREDSDEDDASNDDSDDDDWGPTASRRSSRVPPQPQPPSVPPASGRSKRKLQPPQHIPPPQLHSPLQLRHPTPPPSPPPNLFPLPDTPKQSPPDADHPVGEGSKMASFPPATMQGQESDSSSRSSSPEPPAKRRPGPLSLLVHKMESEQALDEAQSTSAADMSGEEAQAAARSDGAAGVSHSPLKRLEKRRQQENRDEKIRQEEKTKKEEEKKCLEEGRERKQLEEKEKKTDEKMKHQEKSRQEEKWTKREQTSEKDKMLYSSAQSLTEAQDSGSSSDSNLSSRSSYSSEKQSETTRKIKKGDQEQKKDGDGHIFLTSVEEKQHSTKREVSEPSAAAVTEEEPDSESAMALPPASGAEPENSEGPVEESTTPKAFAARKISLTTSNKMSPASAERGGEPETTNAAGRKRRWGSSTAVSAKKPSISITTDSLKSLIPDIKVNQEAVVDLPAEELQYSGDEETMVSTHEDQDNGLKIQRTVTQVVPSDSQKNGQGNEEEDGEKTDREKSRRASKDRRKDSVSEEATEPITSVKPEEEPKKVTPSDSLVRRSISQQKSGVSVTIDDPIRTNRKPSPPRGKVTNIIHVTNLVRPFTLGQLKELLNQTGSMVEDGFWIDKIKSHCYVTYSTAEEAASTRNALHGVKWPQSNPKVLSVDFCEQDEVDFHKGILKEKETDHAAPVPSVPQNRLPPLMPDRERDKDKDRERDRGMGGVRDLWAEREREMERRERARGEREWDRDKIREFARPGEDGRRSRSRDRDRRRRERAKSKERKTEKKEKADEPPAKLLDDLFLKTKAAPCIYWLPLTDEQAAQRVSDRTERQKERERIRKELDEEDKKKREEEKKERLKAREKEGVAVASGGGPARRVSEGDRDRDRGRDREGDRRRDSGHRPRRLSAGNARRSRSRSNPRERRR